jgi:hypothetical protein
VDSGVENGSPAVGVDEWSMGEVGARLVALERRVESGEEFELVRMNG